MYDNRQRAGSFGDDAEQYDRARPSYPDAMIDDLVALFGSGSEARCRVLDVGCGTGIVSRQFRRRGCIVVGVEADERMAAIAHRRDIDVDVSRFEDWAPRGTPFDLVVSGQAWHWIDPNVGPGKAAEVLRPGGALAAFWHDYVYDTEFAAAFHAVYKEIAPDLLESSLGLGTIPEETVAAARQHDIAAIESCGAFDTVEERSYASTREMSGDLWLDELATHSSHRVADASLIDRLLRRLSTVVDHFGGAVTIELRTGLVLASRRG